MNSNKSDKMTSSKSNFFIAFPLDYFDGPGGENRTPINRFGGCCVAITPHRDIREYLIINKTEINGTPGGT